MKRVLFLVCFVVAVSLLACGLETLAPTPTTVAGIIEALTPSTVLIYA